MTAAEQAIAELQQNGLDPLSIAAHAGAEGFVKLARAVLAMQHTQRALGVEMTTPQLIAEVNALARPAKTTASDFERMGKSVARLGVAAGGAGETMKRAMKDIVEIASQISHLAPARARAPKPAKEPRDRSAKRPEQAKARAAKSRRKARKGWA